MGGVGGRAGGRMPWEGIFEGRQTVGEWGGSGKCLWGEREGVLSIQLRWVLGQYDSGAPGLEGVLRARETQVCGSTLWDH